MNKKNKISVAIVDDKKDIRENLEILLNSSANIDCIGTFPNYHSAVNNIPDLEPDVVLMDINMPGKSGIDCIKNLKPKMLQTQFIMLTMYDDSEMVFEALTNGAAGYLLKRTTPHELLDSIVEVYNGGSPMSMEIARMVVDSFKQELRKNKIKEKLTKREWEILGHLSKGMRYKEIAEQLYISVETVRSHLRKIYEKLQVRSATEAVLKYLQK
ncbi:MAG: response regulator transcription factor [Melioribacteraceae bacterium]|nr:response regulator transcription factor [Melioribacteraceae bacterium]